MSRVMLSAFQKDRDYLYQQFVNNPDKSLTFTTFAACWREMKFTFVFCGLDDAEIQALMEYAFIGCLDGLQPEKDLPSKIFSIFLIYGLYCKQPKSYKIKFRLPIKSWNHVETFLIEAENMNLVDVLYIWTKLLELKAFDVVYSKDLHGPQQIPRSTSTANQTSKIMSEQLKKSLEGRLQKLHEIQSKYENLKESLEQNHPDIQDIVQSSENSAKTSFDEFLNFNY